MNSGNFTKKPSLRELVTQQTKINLDIKARLAINDKTLEDINIKIKKFSSAINDHLEYNKKIEAKIAQLAIVSSVATNPEQVKNITTRRGSSTKEPPYQKGNKTSMVIPITNNSRKREQHSRRSTTRTGPRLGDETRFSRHKLSTISSSE